ncbi:hypothetical protein EHQ59_03790 [Leptospira kemamanensis]|uniref:Uncharacterized protein n=1 Tax=Leptospira kemamanensis TaxID=2484942 RepID=A0A4R9JS87_9LEPT|nr:hypothetical protein [Leptospira kemamanensis]TGL55542.1 hypothetical protein EHQ59_03790 [Leptospira kemamanensis]
MGNHRKKSLALFVLTIITTSIFSKESPKAKAIAYLEVVNALNMPAAYLSLDDRLKDKIGFDELNFLLFERSKFLRNQTVKKVLIAEKEIQYNTLELLRSYQFKSTSVKKKTIIDEIILDSQNNMISYEVKLYHPNEPFDDTSFGVPYVDENEEIQISKHLKEYNQIQKILNQKKHYRYGHLFFYQPKKISNLVKEIDMQKAKNDLGIYRKESNEFLNTENTRYKVNEFKILNQTYHCANKAKIFYFLIEIKSEKTFKKIVRAYELNNSKIRFSWTQYTEEMLESDSFIDMIKYEC